MITASGAEGAFKELFAREYSKLCRYALTYLHDSHQAEDVVQETFIKIWEKKQELISSPDLRFYLITAVRNNSISYLRKLRSQNLVFTEAAPEPEPEIHFTPMQRREAMDEQSRRLAEALDRLPPKCKEVFLLVKMHGLSYKQAAESLDISVKTVENQMGKALKMLRDGTVVRLIWLFALFILRNYGTMIGGFMVLFVLSM